MSQQGVWGLQYNCPKIFYYIREGVGNKKSKVLPEKILKILKIIKKIDYVQKNLKNYLKIINDIL